MPCAGFSAGGLPPPPQPERVQNYSFDRYSNMSPFERAALRTTVEMSGRPWESFGQELRAHWRDQEMPLEMPGMTPLTAARQNPMDRYGTEQMLQTFGEQPDAYWERQRRNWAPSQASQVSASTW